jgi:hypothetical protein
MNADKSDIDREMKEIEKDVKDFCTKYNNRLHTYNLSNITRAKRIVEAKPEEVMLSLPDITPTINELEKQIADYREHMEVTKNVKEPKSPRNIEVSELDAIRRTQLYLTKELPKLLNKKNFSFPFYAVKGAYESDGDVYRKNMRKVNDLRKMKVTLIFSFVHQTYKALPNMIKGR